MTRKENYITNILCKKFHISEATAKVIFEESDKLIKTGDTKKYNSFIGMYSLHFQKVIEQVTSFMEDDTDNYLNLDMSEKIDI